MERYESYKMENLALKSEKNQLTEDMEKARLENAALMVPSFLAFLSFFSLLGLHWVLIG